MLSQFEALLDVTVFICVNKAAAVDVYDCRIRAFAAGDEEGNLCSLSDAMLEKYTNLFKEPMFLAW